MTVLPRLVVTTTATVRPELHAQVWPSFRRHLTGVDWSRSLLLLHLDPVPSREGAAEVLRVASETFRWVSMVVADQPSFPRAVKWCLGTPKLQADYFMHVEDDWQLEHDVGIGDLTVPLLDQGDLAVVTLRAYSGIRDDRICLSPGLWRTRAAAEIAARMVPEANPEQQLRPEGKDNPCGGKRGSWVGRQYGDRVLVRDLGREWLARVGWQKDQEVRDNHWVGWRRQA